MSRQKDKERKVISASGALREKIKAYWCLQDLRKCMKDQAEQNNEDNMVMNKINDLEDIMYSDITENL